MAISSAAPSPAMSLGPRGSSIKRLLIVSNRLPVTIRPGASGPLVQPSGGGLATGLRALHDESDALWFGWPGDLGALDDQTRDEIVRRLTVGRTVPVHLSIQETGVFYERISNAILWPLFHDRLDQMPLRQEGWSTYEQINRRFADAVAAAWRPGDTVWIHDYHLLRLPALLRQQIPEARIGFFLHIPFPNPEVFLTLPVRKHLVEGMLGADVIGFHTRRYRGHFTAALRRLLAIEMDADAHVRYQGRRIRLGVFPMGVDAAAIAERSSGRAVSGAVLEMRSGSPHSRLILGLDRLDYSKGIPRRLLAFRSLLRQHPEWLGRVRLMQVAVPSRGGVQAYRQLRRQVETLVSRINGEFATPSWTPIQYLHRHVDDETLLSLFRAADIMLVTPVRDGMNLVAKEFAASRIDEEGVLILSEFAGAADQLSDAMIVNPYDVDGVANTMHAALAMDRGERRRRMRRLREHVLEHNVNRWAREFCDALADARP